MEDKKVCPMCGSKDCTCGKCPGHRINNALCMIVKLMHIIVFIALTFVLFDVHAMLKAQREYANAVTAAMSANAGQAQGNMQAQNGMMQK